MSQKATRKSQNAAIVIEDKEKADNPVKEMKKKIAANAEKEKQGADKSEKPTEKNDKVELPEKNKTSEKQADKSEKNDKSEKTADKKAEKSDKNGEKSTDKPVDKKTDKTVEKKTEQAEKKEEAKVDKSKEKPAKALNGNHNGAAAANGDDINATVSDSSEEELVIEEDEVFPELTYDESDSEAFEAEAPSRSLTRRSQVKATKTPETPRPTSEKESDESKESKLLKLKDDAAVASSDRKLRSADSPKPESKKVDKKPQDSPKKQEQPNQDDEKKAPSKKDLEEGEKVVTNHAKKDDKLGLDVVVEIENGEEVLSRIRSHARVSPYSRPRADVTHTSVMADYTGNNSTMEMDITESSVVEEPSMNDSGYLRGLRGIRGRSSYKVLQEVRLTNPNANKPRPIPVLPTVVGRPMGAVVGRKRKPSDADADASGADADADGVERAAEALLDDERRRHGKRMKIFDRLSLSFRRSGAAHRAADIVGINTDLPLTAPVAAPAFDPETIKCTPALPTSSSTPTSTPRDSSRCHIM